MNQCYCAICLLGTKSKDASTYTEVEIRQQGPEYSVLRLSKVSETTYEEVVDDPAAVTVELHLYSDPYEMTGSRPTARENQHYESANNESAVEHVYTKI